MALGPRYEAFNRAERFLDLVPDVPGVDFHLSESLPDGGPERLGFVLLGLPVVVVRVPVDEELDEVGAHHGVHDEPHADVKEDPEGGVDEEVGAREDRVLPPHEDGRRDAAHKEREDAVQHRVEVQERRVAHPVPTKGGWGASMSCRCSNPVWCCSACGAVCLL